MILFLLAGLFGLWLGTRWLINGAIGIAYRLSLSQSFVGMAILAVGTDLPEVFVSIQASLNQLKGIESAGIVTGNAIGSCISQISVILGLAGLFMTFVLPKKDVLRNGFFLLSSIVLLCLFGLDGTISRIEGTLLIAFYGVYYFLLLRNPSEKSKTDFKGERRIFSIIFYMVAGFVVLIFSAHLVVNNAILLAEEWRVPQSFIGITIVGLGTSLPELAVSAGAAFRKSVGLSVGNIIGSNVFDGLVPIGISGVISTTHINRDLIWFDLPLLFGITLLVLILLSSQGVSRATSIFLMGLYGCYVLLKIYQF